MSLLPAEPEKGELVQVYVNENTNPPILFIVPEEDCEGLMLEDFCRLDEPLEVVIKKDHAFQFRHIEIRKERS